MEDGAQIPCLIFSFNLVNLVNPVEDISMRIPCLIFFLNLVNLVNPVEDISMRTLEAGH